MDWFFWWRMSAQEREAGLALIEHLQRMLAYQQLAIERYNDALASAAGVATPTNEGLRNPLIALSDPRAVRERLLPALRAKDEILREIERQHGRTARPTPAPLRRAYDDFTQTLRILRDRAALQFKGFSGWLDDSAPAVDTTRLDAAELRAIDRALKSLNELITRVGLDGDAWLDLNCEAFNAVRKAVGLGPMRPEEFRSTYTGGLEGKPTRFFNR